MKGEDYTEKQPDGEDDGVDALVSVTVPPQSRSHTQFLQFHFTPEYKKKYPVVGHLSGSPWPVPLPPRLSKTDAKDQIHENKIKKSK